MWRTIRESKFGGLRYNDGKSKKEDSFYVGNVRGERNGIFSDGSDDRDRRDCKTDYRDFTEKLVRAASNMSKSNHPLMRLVRAKFEHGCMVSDKVQNVGAFVEKYLYEYRVLGVRLHTWRQWAKGSIWLCLIFGATGTALAYAAGEREQGLYRYGILGGMGALALFLLRMLADDAYQLEAAKTYMVDFLENTYAHRYEKTNQKEIQVTVQRADEIPEKMDAEENEAAHSGQVQRPFSEETVPASAATVNAVSANEKRYTEDGQMQQTVQTVAKVGQANANQADEMRTQQPGARMEDTAGSRFKQEEYRRKAGADKRGKNPGNSGRIPCLTGVDNRKLSEICPVYKKVFFG